MGLERYLLPECGRRVYREKSFKGTEEEYLQLLEDSSTLYITNISEQIREERLWHLFGICGEVRRVIMGVNSSTKTPCEFAFIEYYRREDAATALAFYRGLELDGRALAVDKDMGFAEGRQYGRGVFGGKVRADNSRKRMRERDALNGEH
ncbi:nuclear cap-binding protein subunit 2 [Pancytospora philotis]|nr:nuclear cap-binding protein subunit 2 [Pancytospora philotis]